MATNGENIYTTSQPLRWLCKFFGVVCVTYLQDKKTVRVTAIDVLCFLFNVVSFAVLIYFGHFKVSIQSGSHVLTNGMAAISRVVYITLLVTNVQRFCCQRRRLAYILRTLGQIDVQLRLCHVTIAQRYHRRVMVATILAHIATVAVLAILASICTANPGHWPLTIAIVGQTIYTQTFHSISFVVYAFGLLAMLKRVHLLNRRLLSIGQIGAATRDRDEDEDRRAEVVRHLRRVHLQLADLAEAYNHCFALPVLALTGSTFAYLLFYLVSVYRAFFLDSNTPNGWYFAAGLGFVGHMVGWLLVVIGLGHRLRRSGEQTGGAIHAASNRLGDDRVPRELVKDLQHFGQQVLHRQPMASCGLFSFDWSLMYSIIAATASYAMILVQVDTIAVSSMPSSDDR